MNCFKDPPIHILIWFGWLKNHKTLSLSFPSWLRPPEAQSIILYSTALQHLFISSDRWKRENEEAYEWERVTEREGPRRLATSEFNIYFFSLRLNHRLTTYLSHVFITISTSSVSVWAPVRVFTCRFREIVCVNVHFDGCCMTCLVCWVNSMFSCAPSGVLQKDVADPDACCICHIHLIWLNCICTGFPHVRVICCFFSSLLLFVPRYLSLLPSLSWNVTGKSARRSIRPRPR